MKKIIITTLYIAIVFSACVQIFGVNYFSHGSYEMFPTDEQQEKVHTIATILIILPIIVEIISLKLIHKISSSDKKSN